VHRFYWYIKKWHTIKSQALLFFTGKTRHCSLRTHLVLHLSLDQPVSVFWRSDFAAPSWLYHINLNLLWSLWLVFRVLTPQLHWIPPIIMQTKQQDTPYKIWGPYSTVALDSNLSWCDTVSLGEWLLWNARNQSPNDTESHTTRPEPKLYCVTHVSVVVQCHCKPLTIITFHLQAFFFVAWESVNFSSDSESWIH
jgi:hypothetical protein